MKLNKLLFVTLMFFSIGTFASEENKKSDWEWLDLSAVLIFQSSNVEKGALIWPGASILPGIGITLFDKLSIQGPRIVWSQFDRESSYHLNITTKRFDDGAPWIKLSDHKKSYRNLRDPVWESEIEFRYKFGFRKMFYVGAKFANAWNEYESTYSELQVGSPFIPFVQIEAALGFMPNKTAQYYYGPGAESGVSHLKTSVKYVFTKLPWNGIFINQLGYSYIIQSKNQEAFFIRGQKDNIFFSSMLAWSFL